MEVLWLLVFVIIKFTFCFYIGLFSLRGSISSSYFVNNTFSFILSIRTNSYLNPYSCGGVLYINTSNYNNFKLDRCFFTVCVSDHGGVIYLDTPSLYILISRCRFLNNIARSYGNDIYVQSYSCFSSSSYITETCTSSSDRNSVYCSSSYKSIILKTCTDRIVIYLIIIF
jgi:hypothetical protein